MSVVTPEPELQLPEGRGLRLRHQPRPDVVAVGVPPVHARPGGLRHHLVPHRNVPGLQSVQLVLQHRRTGGEEGAGRPVPGRESVELPSHRGGREGRRRQGGARGGDVGVLEWRGGGEGVGDVDGDLHSSSAGTLQLGIHSV